MATNGLVTGLKVFLPVMFCVMLATLIYTIITDGLPEPDRRDVFTPWFATTIVDFYINIVPIAVWIVYKETTWFGSILWAILLVVFGSLTTCVYLFMQLLKLTPQEASEDPMYFLLLRDSFKDGVGLRDKKSLVVTARFVFGALGCVMLGALVYTCLTDGSPFRMELLYPWMVVLLVSFYINVAVLSVWVVYKESSWIIGILWVALLLSLGSFGTSVVIVVQLFRLSPLDPLYLVLVKNTNRAGDMYERTHSAVLLTTAVSLLDSWLNEGAGKLGKLDLISKSKARERINDGFQKLKNKETDLVLMIYCVDDEKLKEMFSEFGNVTSPKLSEMIWKDDRKETTYIAFAQRKEDSQAHTYRMLGERLYPLVEKHESLHVAKLTGMLAVGDESSRYLAPDGVRRRTQV
ncbi:BnaA09g30400D [Brassica napus]|uniref:BnaA09g30400D protein n=1 Tax=Brassica napus TaxID=3708 RepID=A0A078G8Q2_BRANA|nr:BnaA09g30400D [Brassica napus]